MYYSHTPFRAFKDVNYQLDIHWKGKRYSATNQLSFVSPLEAISFAYNGNPDSLRLLEVAPTYHPLEQAMHEVIVYWEHIKPTQSSWAKLYFYTFKTLDGSELFKPEEETIYFPRGSIIIRKKFGLNDGFASYLRALVLETRWQGGVYDEASSSLPTNISGGGLGYFSVCSVLSDTLIAQ